ncbi:hypothetical protein BV133_3308 [Blastochloris viridis]|uniref:Uncharacterized protein n=1 Tax=Blastochloris viridis TaxID=1079 RepID=A0A182D784_BLAVI|nr:hypothetical protein BV133_3308 [Blastochloris viridis]
MVSSRQDAGKGPSRLVGGIADLMRGGKRRRSMRATRRRSLAFLSSSGPRHIGLAPGTA